MAQKKCSAKAQWAQWARRIAKNEYFELVRTAKLG